MDTSLIEHRFLRENQLLGLGFPDQGYIFMRCMFVEEVEYNNYEESPGSVAADTFEDSARLPIDAYSIDNLLRVENCDHVYQVFFGINPGAVRQYLYYPYETGRRNLDVKTVYTKAKFGYIDGYQSEYDRPSPASELFIPKDIEVGFGWWNPLPDAVTVELNILIRRMKMSILDDVDLIQRILTGAQPCRLVTLGGASGSMDYRAKDILDVNFITLGSTREEIAAAVA